MQYEILLINLNSHSHTHSVFDSAFSSRCSLWPSSWKVVRNKDWDQAFYPEALRLGETLERCSSWQCSDFSWSRLTHRSSGVLMATVWQRAGVCLVRPDHAWCHSCSIHVWMLMTSSDFIVYWVCRTHGFFRGWWCLQNPLPAELAIQWRRQEARSASVHCWDAFGKKG